MARLVCVVLACLFSACASQVLMTPEEVASVERSASSEWREGYLRHSFYVTPFFGDASKRLLTDVPPEEVRLLNHPDGKPISPGPAEKILPAGTRVRIAEVELPTSWAMTRRVLYTPRSQPWVFLEVAGAKKNQPPLVLVLRPKIRSPQEFFADLERYVSRTDLAPEMAGWSEPVVDAIRKKSAIADMPGGALEMAWGYPERKDVRYEGEARVETWHYADDRRVAQVTDGRVTQLKGP